MISVSPLKLLIVVVVALLLLGPDKIPQAARQIGAGWSAFRRFRQRMEEEIRDSVPDLPAAQEIVRAVRSPVSFLDNLADLHGKEDDATDSSNDEDPAEDNGPDGVGDEIPEGQVSVAGDPGLDGPGALHDPGAHSGGGEGSSTPAPSTTGPASDGFPPVSAGPHQRFTVPADPSMN